jgi:quinol monooxygenase YgiN
MTARRLLNLGGMVLVLSLGGVAAVEEPPVPFVRIAELEIDPARLEAYKTAVKEEMKTSVRVEPGVLAIYAVAEKDNPTKLRFFEMYADEAAYKAHVESAHFKKYRRGPGSDRGAGVRPSFQLIRSVPFTTLGIGFAVAVPCRHWTSSDMGRQGKKLENWSDPDFPQCRRPRS